MTKVDEGRLSVDEPIEKYLSEFNGQMVIVEKPESVSFRGEFVGQISLRGGSHESLHLVGRRGLVMRRICHWSAGRTERLGGNRRAGHGW
jgi:hypothetical protein